MAPPRQQNLVLLVALFLMLLPRIQPAAAAVENPTPDGGGRKQEQPQLLPQPLPQSQAPGDNLPPAAILREMLAGPHGPSKGPGDMSKTLGCQRYIVQLKEPSAVQWAARTEATAAGGDGGSGRVSSNTLASGSVTQYAAFLKTQANAVAVRALGSSNRVGAYYQYSFAGMYVDCVTPRELAALQMDPGVASVSPNRMQQLMTITTPHFLGLDAPGGAWAQLGGLANAGEDVVIGMLDTGYWPESGSFSDQADPNSNSGGSVYGAPPAGFTGTCDEPAANEPPGTKLCNNKVIACRSFPQGLPVNETYGVDRLVPNEYLSCRAAEIHGVHTGSTAGGNSGVVSDLVGASLGKMSGMAPRARLAIYKVCWEGHECPTAAILAAIDLAVKDAVHVLSYSISSSTTDLEDPIAIAFKGAAAVGIFVSAAAGNVNPSNPDLQPVCNVFPWLTTVGASTHNRLFQAAVELGDAQEFSGVGFLYPSRPFGPLPLILSDDAGLPDAKPEEVQLCYNGTLDPEKVKGKIVACDRGVSARVAKSAAVKLAGGAGMLLLNTPNTLDDFPGDVHSVPTAHLPRAARDPIRAYVASAGAAATAVFTFSLNLDNTAPQMADFSMRGPTLAARGELLKPDIVAPGVDVLAAASSPAKDGSATAFLSGTSMATPHISGIAALLKQRHPTWGPMMIKSAIMTTAYQTTKTGPSPGRVFGSPFDFGAGHVDPTAALNPGLVLDSTPRDWERFVCGAQLEAAQWPSRCPECVKDATLCDPQRLNTPSIALANMPSQQQTITRTVTSVLAEAADFTVSITKPGGFEVSVMPAAFSLQPGESVSLSITITRLDSTPYDTYSDGAISWSSSKGTVTRIPIVVKSNFITLPGQYNVIRRNGQPFSFKYNVTTGFTGTLSTLAIGMQPARVSEGTVTQTTTQTFNVSDPAGATGVTAVKVSVQPTQWTYVRVALFAADVSSPETDLDVYVYDSTGRFLGSSTSPTTDEEFNLLNPQTSSVTVYIHGFNVPGGSTNFKLHVWVLRLPSPGSSNAKSLPHAGSPAKTTPGSQVPVTVSLNARVMNPAQRFMGLVLYATNPVDDKLPDAVPYKLATLVYMV